MRSISLLCTRHVSSQNFSTTFVIKITKGFRINIQHIKYFNFHSNDDNKLGEHEDLSCFTTQSRMNLVFFPPIRFFLFPPKSLVFPASVPKGSRVNIFVVEFEGKFPEKCCVSITSTNFFSNKSL